MEYLNSGTLSDVLERNGMPQMKIALDWLTQIARGLKAIHDAGVIHRDIKPENILFDRNGRIKISDFGISTDNETPDFPVDSLTGTINFLCPEYISKGVCDHRGDIYAWGVTAYLLLTGRLPFKGESLIETLSQRVTEDPLPPNKLNLNIPRPVSDLILKALQRNPEKRVKDLAVVLNILDEFAAGEEEIILENSIIAQTQMA